jgi:hypothetical protein
MIEQAQHGNGTTILVGEDDPVIRVTMCWALEAESGWCYARYHGNYL